MNILDNIIRTKQTELAAARQEEPFDRILQKAKSVERPTLSLRKALVDSDTGIIAEFKRRSPSKGFIHEGAKVADVVRGYERAGAAACSILTDTTYFAGAPQDLQQAREWVNIPLLRKDFVIDEHQICEARIWGADVILLIAAALTPERTRELAEFAHTLGLEVLLELHDAGELPHIHPAVDVVGINNRNLTTFGTDIDTSFGLAKRIPTEYLRISESAISATDTVKRLREAGFRGFLMGENFMKENDPAKALEKFIEKLRS